MPRAVGARLGQYEMLDLIGAGGMGEVYCARDTRLGRTIAIKLLPSHCADPDRRSRFEREARALAALNHPNIVTVYSVESREDQPFLTMELIQGKTLGQMIPVGGMALGPLLSLAIQMADALEHAHRHGVVHRDLKPGNVMVSNEGRLKVLDFGLARLEPDTSVLGESPTVEALTRGRIVGTCGYMSPEQAQGSQVDARSDIFSLGTILFEMATGRRPFMGEGPIDVLAAVARAAPPPVRTIRPEMPDTLERIIGRCLEKDPERRVQTARDVCNELEAIRQSTGSDSMTHGRGVGLPGGCDRRVAVLPFANISADPEQEYFCDGIAEDLINALAHVEGLHVAARTSTFAFKGQNRDVRQIGRLLDVGTVLEGSVQRSGTRLRITAQIVQVADGMHLWSERFDRQLDDVFAIQDEISLAIVDRLKVKLLDGEQARVVRRHTADPEAHNLYLKGRYLFGRRTEGDLTRAMAAYEQAKAADPDYALPYVGVADALLVLAQWHLLRPLDALPKAKRELERALALDTDLAEAHASLGMCLVHAWDWERAERHFIRAIELNPRYVQARHWYAILLCLRRRFDDALRESRIGLSLEPLSPAANAHSGQILFHTENIPAAITQLLKALELDPHMPLAHAWLQMAYLAARRPEDALAASEHLPWPTLGCQIGALALAGRMDEARQRHAALQEMEQSRHVGQVSFAMVEAALGNHEAAVARLQLAFDERDPQLPFMRVIPLGPWWAGLIADARVEAIARQIGLPDSNSEARQL